VGYDFEMPYPSLGNGTLLFNGTQPVFSYDFFYRSGDIELLK
jgi:hypothetical protein